MTARLNPRSVIGKYREVLRDMWNMPDISTSFFDEVMMTSLAPPYNPIQPTKDVIIIAGPGERRVDRLVGLQQPLHAQPDRVGFAAGVEPAAVHCRARPFSVYRILYYCQLR